MPSRPASGGKRPASSMRQRLAARAASFPTTRPFALSVNSPRWRSAMRAGLVTRSGHPSCCRFFFGSLGARYDLRPFTALALLSMFGWLFTAIVQRIERARFQWRIWGRLERRAPVPPLWRQEKIRRGFASSHWQTASIALIGAFGAVLQAPSRLIPPEWRDIRRIVVAFFCILVVGGFLAHGAFRLLRRFRL